MRMQRLPRKLKRTQRVGPISIPRLAHQRVTVQPGLQPDLVPAAGHQPDLDERGTPEPFDDPILAPRFLPTGIPRMRLLLNELLLIPNEAIGPGSRRGRRVAVDHREVHPLRLAAPKLILQLGLSIWAQCKDDETGGVAIDTVNHQRPFLAFRPEMQHELVLDGRGILLTLERDGQKARWLVDDDQGIVFVNDRQLSGTRRTRSFLFGTAGTIRPELDSVAADEARCGLGRRGLCVIDEDPTSCEGVGGASP